jgi:hypothetical protein
MTTEHGATRLNESQAQNGRNRANLRELPTLWSGLIRPASIVAAITWKAMAACPQRDGVVYIELRPWKPEPPVPERGFGFRTTSRSQPLLMAKTVALELEWLLRSYYGFSVEQVLKVFDHLLAHLGLTAEDRAALEPAVASALLMPCTMRAAAVLRQ